jgi:hypothetical protein
MPESESIDALLPETLADTPNICRSALACTRRVRQCERVNTVGLRKVKRLAGAGVWRAYELGEDEHGLWLYTPKGSRYRGVDEAGRVVELEVGQGNRDAGCSVVGLIAPNAWWIAVWYDHQGYVPGRGRPVALHRDRRVHAASAEGR